MASSAGEETFFRSSRAPSPADLLLEEEHISEDEWDVEDILAETVMKADIFSRQKGERCWLISWTGYPLSEATWEPRNHLQEALLEKWELDKAQYASGKKKPFKIRLWKRAVISQCRENIEMQKAENRIRRARGVDLLPVDDLDYVLESLNKLDSENDSEDEVDWEALDRDAEKQISESDMSDSGEAETSASSNGTDDEGGALRKRSDHERVQRPEHSKVYRLPKPSQQTSGSAALPSGVTSYLEPRPRVNETGQNKAGLSKESTLGREPAAKRVANNTTSSLPASMPQSATSLPSKPPKASKATKTIRTTSARDQRAMLEPEIDTRNVFLKPPDERPKRSIERAVDSANAEPKMFNYRKQRIVEKRYRDNEGTRDPRLARRQSLKNAPADASAPPKRPAELDDESSLFVSPGPEIEMRGSTEPITQPNMDVEMLQDEREGTWAPQQQISPAFGFSAAAPRPARPSLQNKSKRSVRFQDDATEPADTRMGEGTVVSALKAPVAGALPETDSQDLVKPCTFGPSSINVLHLRFVGLRGELLSRVSGLKNAELLKFKHQCTAEDFEFARQGICAGIVASGSIRVAPAHNSPRFTGERLAHAGVAILCYMKDFCVLLMPKTGVEWQLGGFAADVSDDQGQLRYVVFRPTEEFQQSTLEPFDHSKVDSSTSDVLGFNALSSFDIARLLPPNLRQSGSPYFFLLFPASAQDECSLLAGWLRQCDNSCGILVSLIPGHWSDFVQRRNGGVIIHREAMELVRLLPGLGRLIWNPDSVRNFSFWSYENGALSSSLSGDDCALNGPEDAVLKPLLPDGTVYLVTPSFLIARPYLAYEFLKWFSKRYVEPEKSRVPICKLALCAEPDIWVASLARRVPDELKDESPDFGGSEDANNIHMRIRRLLAKLKALAEPDDQDSLGCPVLLAPSVIDGNDEQSLVNWFSWWTTTSLHLYRKFEVVGTGYSDRFLLKCLVRAPRYQATSVVDRSVSMDRLEEAMAASVRDAIPTADRAPRTRKAPVLSRAELNNTALLMESKLRDFQELVTTIPAILFNKPVCHFAEGMAVKLGDTRFATFQQWFNFFHPLREIRNRRNTYIGFFFTIETEWDPDVHQADVPRPCRPWIAIFRPQNPFRRPWAATELLIWDTAFGTNLSGKDDIFESDLIPAQQALVKIVANQNELTNEEAPLAQVWAGGFGDSNERLDPLDDTYRRLKDILTNFKSDLDARSDRLPTRGWKPVSHGDRPASSVSRVQQPPASASKTETPSTFTLGESEDEDDDDERKIVFHPPRGDEALYSRHIENRLLKACQKAKDEKRGDSFEFQFAPTQQWYGYMKPSKRHTEHIRVVQWSTTFKEVGIEHSEK